MADILPSTDVSYNNGHMATISEGTVLYIDDVPFSNVSDILAIADGTDASSIDGLFFEPGRVFFHTLEFCTFAHNCEQSDSRAAIVIRKLVNVQIKPHITKDFSVLCDMYTCVPFKFGMFST